MEPVGLVVLVVQGGLGMLVGLRSGITVAGEELSFTPMRQESFPPRVSVCVPMLRGDGQAAT